MLCALPIILVIALQCVAGAPIEDKGSSTTTGATSEWPDKDILEPFNLRAQYGKSALRLPKDACCDTQH